MRGTFLPRKLYEPGGLAYAFTDGKCLPLAPHLAGLESGHRGEKAREVPWTEILDRRRERQRERLLRKRTFFEPEPRIVPCYVWTFFNRQMIPYHGWYCYVVSRHFSIAVNFRDFRTELATSIMTAIPLGFLPITESFRDWMEAFAKEYPRTHPLDSRKAGSKIGWITDQRIFTLERPTIVDNL